MAENQCPPPTPEETNKEIPSKLRDVMLAAGIRSCETSASKSESNWFGQAEANFMGLAGSTINMGGSTMDTKNSSVGCEQVVGMARSTVTAVNRLKCTLKKNILSNDQTGVAVNSVTIAGYGQYGYTEMKCPGGLTIDQRNKIFMKSVINFSDSDTEYMVNSVKEGIKDIATTLQESKTGWAATPQGSKMLQEISEKTINNSYDADIKDNIMKIKQRLEGKNNVTLGADGRTIIEADKCNINQENYIEILAQNIFTSTVQKVFNDFFTKDAEYTKTTTQTAENAGAPTIQPIPPLKGTSTMAMIIGLILLFLCCISSIIGGYYYYTNK